MPVHLATHSFYSLLAGLPKPAELAAAAARAGHRALALSDHNRLTGSVEFCEACEQEGLRPIFGLQVKLAELGLPLTLLAKDAAGWASMCRLSSWLLSEENDENRRLPFDVLYSDREGLICLAEPVRANMLSPKAELEPLRNSFGDAFYLQCSPLADEWNISLAQQLGVPLVAAWPVYYLKPEQASLQRTLAAMRLNTTITSLPEEQAAPPNAFFPSNEEWQAGFAHLPGALAATEEIAERCNFKLELNKPNYPEMELPGGQAPIDALRERALEGARQLYHTQNPELLARIEHELAGIQASGYTTLFLIMAEIVSFARQADVPLSSRGSAASSLVAHCLGITTPDPMRLNLYFERFLNPARPTPPDIDTDICSSRRSDVINHVYQHYGYERVAMVATINRFRRRSALREVAKAHGVQAAQISRMVAMLPYRFWGPPGSLPETSERPYGELEKQFNDQRSLLVFQQAEAILDTPHHLSIHPGGIVISSGPLTDTVPLQSSGKERAITQYDLSGVQKMGLVKMDLLGIRGLTVLGNVADQICSLHPELGSSRLEILEQIPDKDPATAETVRNGRTIGCFQIESPGMRATLREVQSDSIDNVMVALALFRPGPLTGGLKDAFIRRHLGQEPVHHVHAALAPILEETHGVFLYQEQVLRVAHELAGFSLAESDLLRRAMSHFDPGKQMQTLKEKFIAGAGTRHQIAPAVGERIWEMMAAFAGYGFPKAHAASYALTAWRSAWCKTHYPAEFMAAVLANWGGYYDQNTYLMEARRLGLKIHPPHINYSEKQFSVSYIDGEPHLFMGMEQLRDLTRNTQERISQMRPFGSLADLLTRAYPRAGEARNLIEVGALGGLGSIPNLLKELESGNWKRGQMPLFTTAASQESEIDWSVEQKAEAQERLIGVNLTAHPLDVYREQLRASGVISTAEAATRFNENLRVAGMRQTWRRVKTSAGYLYFTDLADFEGTLRVAIPEDVYLRGRSDLAGRQPLLIQGRLELGRDSAEPLLRASKVERLSPDRLA